MLVDNNLPDIPDLDNIAGMFVDNGPGAISDGSPPLLKTKHLRVHRSCLKKILDFSFQGWKHFKAWDYLWGYQSKRRNGKRCRNWCCPRCIFLILGGILYLNDHWWKRKSTICVARPFCWWMEICWMYPCQGLHLSRLLSIFPVQGLPLLLPISWRRPWSHVLSSCFQKVLVTIWRGNDKWDPKEWWYTGRDELDDFLERFDHRHMLPKRTSSRSLLNCQSKSFFRNHM